MKRVSSTQLATLAHDHPGSEIEVGVDVATQFLTLPDGRTFYASPGRGAGVVSAPQWKPGDVVSMDASTHWTGLDRGRAAARVAAFLREIEDKWGGAHAHLTANSGGRDTLQWLAEEFEAVSKDPKPEEPQGLGAVVEDAQGGRWVNTHRHEPWLSQFSVERSDYSEIDVVRILNAGWSE